MTEIHCHTCGGFIADPVTISYRLPVEGAATASPHTALCTCNPAVVYGPPPGWMTSDSGMTASRN